MTTLSTQAGTLATVPALTAIAADQVGTANAPAAGDRIQYVKLDTGAAGVSAPVTQANPMPVAVAPAISTWAQALSVANASTATIVNIASSAVGYQIRGMVCHGTGDGYFAIQVGGVTVLSGRTRSTAPMLQINLTNGIAVAAASVVALKVTNESGSTADYDATLLGA